MKSLVITAFLPALIAASFSLNDSGPDWDYTANDLLNTTSQACKDAYSAQIDCPDTLVGIVASMRPAFSPTSSDLDDVCTHTCKSSLDSYVENVKKACSADGDKAKESLGGACNPCKYTYDPVEIVGQIFQYSYAQSCRKADSSGDYCAFNKTSSRFSNFHCDDECALKRFTIAHNYEVASTKQFNYYYLIGQTDYWIKEFEDGWDTVKKCEGITEDDSTSSAAASSSKSSKSSSATATKSGHHTATAAAMTTGTTTEASASSETTSSFGSRFKATSASESAATEAAGNAGSQFRNSGSILGLLVGLCAISVLY
ncbi:uncharacterized protein K452DRAFT_288409 [Aplosporella prunicola CBS 121167]|uniref:WSC domain-containing protein n=1 Tax=Aplosporella prunicola CBS 121167 TaxID=1176127 RepID=A0A6A6BAH5_9PEZI|nr:uncharacterized protein K452DRAFT_288409 [Aplosporella prunicola CBS 121167]KAF2141026.1 hypothetical protein K452DRAFT_288409 [Aplosporella prunicola CBS 121167]